MHPQARTPTAGCCTRREIGPVGVEDEASGHAMEAADMIRGEGTEVMLTATPHPPETGGVEAMRTDRERPSRSVGTMARKSIEKTSAGKSVPTRREPDPEMVPSIPTREIGSVCTTPKTPGEPEKGRSL